MTMKQPPKFNLLFLRTMNKWEVGILLFLIVGFLIYFRLEGKVHHLRHETLDLQKNIKEVEVLLANGMTPEEGVRLLTEEYEKLNSKFPTQEEEALKLLSEFARRLNVDIVSVKAQPKTDFVDAHQKEIVIEGRKCQEVTVSLDMKSSYKDLLKYIETLKVSLPAFFRIERLKATKETSGQLKLNVVLELKLYLLS